MAKTTVRKTGALVKLSEIWTPQSEKYFGVIDTSGLHEI